MGNSQKTPTNVLHTRVEKQVRYYSETGHRDGDWVDAQLSLNSAGVLTVSGSAISKSVEIVIPPFVEISPPSYGTYEGVFVIHSKPESEYSTGPRFACKKPEDTERWIQLLSFVALKKRINLRHKHPLTPSTNTKQCTICAAEKAHPSAISQRAEGTWVCEFCENYAQCEACHSKLEGTTSGLVQSPSHEHQLLRLDSASGFWVQKGYGGRYECDKCGTTSDSVVYHCVECGDYDECPKCALKGSDLTVAVSKRASDLALDLQDLSHVIDFQGQKYSLNIGPGKLCPEHMSVKTNKYWDLSTIETEPATHAYMEVTFDNVAEDSLVGVGIGNQIFGQNEMLGYQQNSFGVFNDGTASVNSSKSSRKFFDMKFGKGDTIGVGMLFDSYNQRKAYFTKNGQYVGVIEDTLHKGMDCFPGVSFMKQSQVAFTVNFTGPFKFNPSSIPNYRDNQRGLLSTIPSEIMNVIAGYSALSVAQVNEMRKVSKKFAESFLSNQVWKTLYLQAHKNQNPDLKIKSWFKFYKRRATEVKSYDETIENCDMEFECPLKWADLKRDPSTNNERFCDKCQKTVYRVTDAKTMQEYTEMGRCTVMRVKDLEKRGWDKGEMMGKRARPPPFNYVSPWESPSKF